MIKVKTKNGLTAYFTTIGEINSIGGLGICDDCGSMPRLGGYLVPILNNWQCPDCYEEWQARAKRYPEDDEFEQEMIKYYESVLEVDPIYHLCRRIR